MPTLAKVNKASVNVGVHRQLLPGSFTSGMAGSHGSSALKEPPSAFPWGDLQLAFPTQEHKGPLPFTLSPSLVSSPLFGMDTLKVVSQELGGSEGEYLFPCRRMVWHSLAFTSSPSPHRRWSNVE